MKAPPDPSLSEGAELGERGTFEVEDRGGVRIVRLHGEHDLSTVHDFRQALDGAAAAPVVIDLGTVAFIDSSVIGVVLALAESPGATSIVLPSDGHVAHVLRTVAIGEVLPAFHSVADAVAAAGGSA